MDWEAGALGGAKYRGGALGYLQLSKYCVIGTRVQEFFSYLIVGTSFVLSCRTVSGQSSVITYQGMLSEGGRPAQGIYDFRFRLALDPPRLLTSDRPLHLPPTRDSRSTSEPMAETISPVCCPCSP